MSTPMACDTQHALCDNAKDCDSRSLLLDRLVFANAHIDEARKLHFAQVCSDSFGLIRSTRADWQSEANRLREREAETRDRQAQQRLRASRETLEGFIADTAGMGQRSAFVGPGSMREVCVARQRFLGSAAGDSQLHAQLQSRLMVDMAGGVIENAGLCLDRFGLPYVPGSAVKGCARRAALAALREWCETGQKPGTAQGDADNTFRPACAPFSAPADMLLAIARTFGWTELDWKEDRNQEGRFKSDFAWACEPPRLDGAATPAPGNPATQAPVVGAQSALGAHASIENAGIALAGWRALRNIVVRRLAAVLGVRLKDEDRAPWKRLPNFGGAISFLPAYPVNLNDGTEDKDVFGAGFSQVPPTGKLELDVVTVHHKHYYAEPAEPKDVPESHSKWQRWKQEHDQWKAEWGTAPDTDEPVPNVFPAVAAGHVFTFALRPLRGADASHARTWLACGLSAFGLGAKTNAGYGWFDCSEAVQQATNQALRDRADRERRLAEQKDAAEREAAEAQARTEEKAAREAALAGLLPEQRADKEVELMTDSQFDAKVRAFFKEPKKGGPTEEQRRAIVRALRGPRLAYWQHLKAKATQGDLAKAADAIRQLSKQMFAGKEGKMP